MKKFFATLLTLLCIATCSLALTACGGNNTDSGDTGNTGNTGNNTAHERTLTRHSAVQATCTENGNIEYWTCSGCNKNFTDANGTTEVTETATQATGHTYSTNWTADDDNHWYSATCEHTELKKDQAQHTIVDGTCSICNKKQFSQGLSFKLNDDKKSYSCTGIGTETATDIVIPTKYENKPVTTIGRGAFHDCISLTSVTIPNSVTTIGSSAFYGCKNLSTINYTGDIASWCKISELDNLMWYGTSDKKLYINNVEITGDLVIPDGVTTIGSYAFYKCSGLTSVTIGNSVTSIGDYAFWSSSSLSTIKYTGDIKEWLKISGSDNLMCYGSAKKLYINNEEIKDLVIPDGVTSIPSCAFA